MESNLLVRTIMRTLVAKVAFGAAVTNPVWGQPSNITIGVCKGLTVPLTGTRKSNNTETVYFVNVCVLC